MQPNKLKITNDDQNIELSEAGARGYTTLSVNKGKSEIRVRAYFNATRFTCPMCNTQGTTSRRLESPKHTV